MSPDVLVFVPFPGARARRIGLRILVASFLAGGLVAVAASGGILWERLSFGDPIVAFIAGGALLFSAFLLLLLTQRCRAFAFKSPGGGFRPNLLFSPAWIDGHRVYRLRGSLFLAAQLAGALAGLVGTCTASRLGPLANTRWLFSSPTLLVNDVVADGCVLLLVWGLVRDLDTRLLVVALVVMTGYRLTAGMWHVIGAPHTFVVTVQQAVLVQFVVIALALIQSQERATRT